MNQQSVPQRAAGGAVAAGPVAVWAVFGLLVFALLGTAWLIDPYANAAFDAPKRLVAMCTAIVGACILIAHGRQATLPIPRWARWILILLLVAIIAALISTVLAPYPAAAWQGLRTFGGFALFVALGATPLLDRVFCRRLFQCAAIAVLLNAALSLLQANGIALPIAMAQIGGRFPTGALLGNEGYVALACALIGAGCFAILWRNGEVRARALAASMCALCIVTIVANRQMTSAIALAAAMVSIVAVQARLRWIVPAGVVLVLCAVIAATVTPLRDRTWAALPGASVEHYQALTTSRLGAWAAAVEMIRVRPLTGFGPGSYALQAQPWRQRAEIRLQQRLLPPPPASAFVFAHQEYLQLAAEIGVPALCALLAAFAILLAALLRIARQTADNEAMVLLGILIAGAVSALAWFPLQIPFTAVVLLVATGRAWRLILDVPVATR